MSGNVFQSSAPYFRIPTVLVHSIHFSVTSLLIGISLFIIDETHRRFPNFVAQQPRDRERLCSVKAKLVNTAVAVILK